MSGAYQQRVIDFLASGDAFGGVVPEHIETHISHIFLTSDRAYKLKRAVDLNFLDFTRLNQRKVACEREVTFNCRSAPGLYLRALPVTGGADGLHLGGQGEAVEWLVEMRRFDRGQQFDYLAETGGLTKTMMADLAERLIDFQRNVEPRPDKGGADVMLRTARDVGRNLAQYGARFLDDDAVSTWSAGIDFALSHERTLLDTRRKAGLVRHCHGDLHLGNICLYKGAPVLFDCIEFSDNIACIDVLYDLAFLCMDLVYVGQKAHANLILNRVLSATRDFEGLRLWPAFLSLRAAVRAMTGVIALETEDAPPPDELEQARAHLALALDLLAHPTPRLVGVGGLSGSGKSSLAGALATRIAPGAGAVVVSSDVLRKRLYGVPPETALPPAAYAPDISARTYTRLFEDVDAALHAGQTVIADATFMRPEDRAVLSDMAHGYNLPFTGLWLDAPDEMLKQRVAARMHDPSDADIRVIDTQRSQSVGTIDWLRVDSTNTDTVDIALAAIQP